MQSSEDIKKEVERLIEYYEFKRKYEQATKEKDSYWGNKLSRLEEKKKEYESSVNPPNETLARWVRFEMDKRKFFEVLA